MAISSSGGDITLAEIAGRLRTDLTRWQLDAVFDAVAIQHARRESAASRRDGVTRSTLIYALCRRSTAVFTALSRAGLDIDLLAEYLKIGALPLEQDDIVVSEVLSETPIEPVLEPDPVAATEVLIEPALAVALERYLASGRDVTDVDLARAVLQSASLDEGGVVQSRLLRAGLDVGSALRRLDDPSGADPSEPPLSDQDLSESVRKVRRALGSSGVTAAAIVQRLQPEHHAYGAETFASVVLDPEIGERRNVDEWLGAVKAAYDMAVVRASRHRVLDGTLVILALADLDDALSVQLNNTAFLARLSAEAEVRPKPNTNDRTTWSSDAPATTDLLGRQGIAVALVRRIVACVDARDESFLVHVDAPWGAGKSSLFNLLEKELKGVSKVPGRDGFLVVKVNAWREQQVGLPWWTILSALQRAVARDAKGWGRVRVWSGTLIDRIRARWIPFAVAVLVLIGVIAGVIAAILGGFDLVSGSAVADSILKIISLAAVVFAGLGAAIRFLLPGSKRTAEQLVENSDNPMREVGQLFARTLARARRDVVFLIDDLDRCDADYVVDFLEVVQTLVKTAPELVGRRRSSAGAERHTHLAGPFGFVAADGRWIRQSYEQRFEKFERTTVPGRPLGYLFLEKIFQLHFLLPTVTPAARDAYFQKLLNAEPQSSETRSPSQTELSLIDSATNAARTARTEKDLQSVVRLAQEIQEPTARMKVLNETAARYSDPQFEKAARHLLMRFAGLIDPNPRSIKLFVNTYGILQTVRTIEESVVPSEPLALWIIIEIRWPELADLLREHPSIVDSWRSGEDLPESASLLLAEPAIRAVLEDHRWVDLTSDRIREVAGAH